MGLLLIDTLKSLIPILQWLGKYHERSAIEQIVLFMLNNKLETKEDLDKLSQWIQDRIKQMNKETE